MLRWAAIVDAFRFALQWRLLVAWTLGLLLPTAVAATPPWGVFADALDHSPRALSVAQHFDVFSFEDMVGAAFRSGPALSGAALLSLILALALSPLLHAMTRAAVVAGRPLGFGELLRGAVEWYGRMLRIGLVSLIPLGIVGAVAALAYKTSAYYEARAVLESQARTATRTAVVVTLLVFVLAHVTVEAARAELCVDDNLRSGFRAWLRGMERALGRPWALLGTYLGTTVVSFLIAALLLVVRLNVTGSSTFTFLLGFLLTQLVVAVTGWGRASRLFALTALARNRTLL